jgi:hypothetical protein
MSRKFFLFAGLCLTGAISWSQNNSNTIKKTSFNLGPQFSVAAADLATTQSVGIGLQTQLVHRIAPKTDLLASVRFNHFFGKKIDGYSEPGGTGTGYNYGGGKYDGMNEFNFSGGIRGHFGNQFFGDAEGGLCLGFGGGETESAGFLLGAFGGAFGQDYANTLAIFFGLCGDPKIHIGLRYTITL